MWICIPQTRRDLAKISPLRPFQTELFQHPSPDWQTHRGSGGRERQLRSIVVVRAGRQAMYTQ